ncbi:hypothetical protein NKR23_g6444 [Pleurostoma richardsiae]|uniref:Uncharacterized protein n=1 Tax=Pleurostoma richardsiae TaxID=41990 RepID=A0AA38VPA2_9PEZI|nr:hypothetical protein NKR23_g6444 [Pleurostoma richardsiae]
MDQRNMDHGNRKANVGQTNQAPADPAEMQDLEPNVWIILSNIPFCPLYKVAPPASGHALFKALIKQVLVRVPKKKSSAPFKEDNGRIENWLGALVQATGKVIVPHSGDDGVEQNQCHRCQGNKSGQWFGCVAPQDNITAAFGGACGCCIYSGNKTRCSLFKGEVAGPKGTWTTEDENGIDPTVDPQPVLPQKEHLEAFDNVVMFKSYLIAFTDPRWSVEDLAAFTRSPEWRTMARNSKEIEARDLAYRYGWQWLFSEDPRRR